jgi:hypothetical protein
MTTTTSGARSAKRTSGSSNGAEVSKDIERIGDQAERIGRVLG